jgi:3-dehydroquinate synthase
MNIDKEMPIKSRVHDYVVGFVKRIDIPNDTLTIIDSNVLSKYKFLSGVNVVALDCSEENKNLETVSTILRVFQENGINRNSKVVFVGGGVLQDLGTISTSIYMRGISWSYFPTTLQAMLDSCIGGKSSINLNFTKNVIGNYYPPEEIGIWTEFLSTLDHDQIVCGLIEGLKICASASRVEDFLDLCPDDSFDDIKTLKFEELIGLSLSVKKEFIESDEFDNGIRKLLNYGHTFGHAIESSSNYAITHGAAVGIGILAAHALARDLGLLDKQTTPTEIAVIRLLGSLDSKLAENIKVLDLDATVTFMCSDKKTTTEKFTFILPSDSGLLLESFPSSQVNKERIKKALTVAFLKF